MSSKKRVVVTDRCIFWDHKQAATHIPGQVLPASTHVERTMLRKLSRARFAFVPHQAHAVLLTETMSPILKAGVQVVPTILLNLGIVTIPRDNWGLMTKTATLVLQRQTSQKGSQTEKNVAQEPREAPNVKFLGVTNTSASVARERQKAPRLTNRNFRELSFSSYGSRKILV